MALALTTHPAHASEHCSQPIAQIVSIFGTVEYRAAPQQNWREASLDLSICPEDSIRTGAESRAAIVFPNTETVVRIDQNTEMKVRSPQAGNPSFLDLLIGSLRFFTRTPRPLTIQTPFVNAGVEGTEFFIGVTDDRTSIIVFEGHLRAQNDLGTVIVTNNQAAEARANQAPTLRIVARPRDAVQWTLFYPPVFTDPANPALSALLRRAARLLAAGQANEAADALAAAPDTGDVLALRTVIAVARNEQERALELGHRAVAASPDSAPAKIALSYAQQASFDLEAARDTVVKATEQQPEDALAWARLAELWLTFGDLDRSLEAAEIAATLAPKLGRTNMVLGFAYLAQIRTKQAQEAFAKAIKLDSQEPLARLGLGLAKIRQGALSEGRRDIEIAAALDPGSAVMRSYLGKAYFEEGSDIFSPGYFRDFFAQRRYEQAATQLSMAKELDPNDPTPWFYDATLKQARNDPIGALDDIEKSIELNDNRAVYRSRFLLDQDRASRGVSLARIYQDLGFEQLAVIEGTRSLGFDPANYSAHRFLSDSYRAQPRHEIARASELLQAQLLQPINIRPVQPQSSETDLNILAGVGPAKAAFNEFTPLFERNRMRLDASGIVGNNDTLSDEAVVSWIAGRASFSAGQFHYETKGFRENNDLHHDIKNLFFQAQLTHELEAQFEYRYRKTSEGDLRLNFDPDNFSTLDRRGIRQETPRIGLHYAPSPRSDFIASFLQTDREESLHKVDVTGATVDDNATTDGTDGQAQYLFRTDLFNITAGVGYSDLDVKDVSVVDISGAFPGGVCPPFIGNCQTIDATAKPLNQYNAYLYTNVAWPSDMIWTFGLSYDSYEHQPVNVDNFSPKLGVQWDITPNVRLRLAYMQTLKRSLIVNQTLEPTQVAGFNQFFDDFNGTKTDRFGIGFDARISKNLKGGVETSWRNLDLPRQGTAPPRVLVEDQHENLYRAYLYWTPGRQLAVGAEVQYEEFRRKEPAELSSPLDLPTKVQSTSVPISLRYFQTTGPATGLFGEIGTTYVHQDVDLSPVSTFEKTSDDFVLLDAAIGYRLPHRLGLVSLEGRNLLDQDFLFQDLNIQQSEPSNPRFFPERTTMFRVTLNF